MRPRPPMTGATQVHDGNFVADGLVFPDRTPSPGLLELKKVIEPVRIEAGPGWGVRIANLHQFKDLSHVAFQWTLEVDGELVVSEPATSGCIP